MSGINSYPSFLPSIFACTKSKNSRYSSLLAPITLQSSAS